MMATILLRELPIINCKKGRAMITIAIVPLKEESKVVTQWAALHRGDKR